MKVIFLPGYSLYNQSEMNEVADNLELQGLSVIKVDWEHWNQPERSWDIKFEVAKVNQVILESGEESFVLVAKSIGTLVAINLLRSINKARIKKVVLMGIPFNDLTLEERDSYKEVLSTTENIQLSVLQNELDNHGTAADVVKMLDGVSLQMVIKPEVADHKYNYPADIYKLIS